MTVLLSIAGMALMFVVGIYLGRRHALGASVRIPAKDATARYLDYVRLEALGKLSDSDAALYKNGDESVVTDEMNAIMDDRIYNHRKLRLKFEAALGQARKNEIESRMYEKTNPQAAARLETSKLFYQDIANQARKELNNVYATQWKQLPPAIRANTPAL